LKYADVQIISIADLQNLLAGLMQAVCSASSCLLHSGSHTPSGPDACSLLSKL